MQTSDWPGTSAPDSGTSARHWHGTRLPLIIAGGFAILAGAIAVAGWHLHKEMLLRIVAGLPVMRYNTALALIGLGGALLAVGFGKPSAARVLAMLPGVIAVGVLVEHATGASFGIDELWMRDSLGILDFGTAPRHPGRIPLATAGCIAGLVIELMASQQRRPLLWIAVPAAAACAALAGAVLVGFALGIVGSTEDWLSAGMALHSAAPMTFAAIVLLVHLVSAEDPRFPHFVSLGAALGAMSLVLVIHHGLSEREDASAQQALNARAASLRNEWQDVIAGHSSALRRMAQRWSVRGGMPRVEWESDAFQYLNDLPCVDTIAWIAPPGQLRWSLPVSASDTLATIVRGTGTAPLAVIPATASTATPPTLVMSAQVTRPDGGLDGHVVATCNLQTIATFLLARLPSDARNVSLLVDDVSIRQDAGIPATAGPSATQTFLIGSSRATVGVHADQRHRSGPGVRIPETILAGGSLMAVLLALALDGALVARQQTRALGAKREELVASEKHYRSLIDAMSEGLSVHVDGRCAFCNASLASMLGYRTEELIGLSFEETIGPEYLEVVSRRFRQRLEGVVPPPPRQYEIQLLHRDGHAIWVEIESQPTEFGGKSGALVLFREIEARKAQEMRLRSEQERFELVARGGVDGVWDWNPSTGAFFVSDRGLALLGRPPDAPVTTFDAWLALVDADEREAVGSAMTGHLRNRIPFDMEFRMVMADGTCRWYRCAGQARWNISGTPSRMAGSFADIEPRKRAEEALAESEATFRGAMEHSALGMALVSLDGRWLSVNPSVCAIVGYTREELLSLTFQDITHPDDLDADLTMLHDMLDGRLPSYRMEKRYLRKDGSVVWVVLTVSAARDSLGKPKFFVSQLEDIDQRKQQERQIAEALQEKELLLREVYHRVKNNLQVIRSLLKLQSRALVDGEARSALMETAERVRSMALVHEKLYQSRNLATITTREFVDDLVAQIRDSSGMDTTRVALDTSVARLRVGLDVAIPLGLLLNELLTNAVKHAFPDQRKGRIRVILRRRPVGAELIVDDDGVGIRPDLIPETTRSMGFRLATGLARQLGGALQLTTKAGTRFTATIHSLLEPEESGDPGAAFELPVNVNDDSDESKNARSSKA